MKANLLANVAVVAVLLALPARVHSQTLKVLPYSANVKITSGSSKDGACGNGYSATCPTGVCGCFQFTGVGSGSWFGHGPILFDLTIDEGDVTVDGNCYPAYGSLTAIGTKDSEILDVVAAYCISTYFALLNGGFALDHQSTRLSDAVGALTSEPKGLKLSGEAEIPEP